jgi:hypothetical protein
MLMRSWVLKSWPEVFWHLPNDFRQGPVFQHMGTELRAEKDELGRVVGETVWAARLADDRLIGAAWEWVEVLPGVPAIRDPNCIVSNVRLLDDRGTEMSELQSIVGLNRIAHATPWQQEVAQLARGLDPRPLVPAQLPRVRGHRESAIPVAAIARQLVESLAPAA